MLTEAVLLNKIQKSEEVMDSFAQSNDDHSDWGLEDIGAIGRILQKALKKNEEKNVVDRTEKLNSLVAATSSK